MFEKLFGKNEKTPAPTSNPDDCPQCGAKPDRRMPSNGFGPTFKLLCGACGHSFGEQVRRA